MKGKIQRSFLFPVFLQQLLRVKITVNLVSLKLHCDSDLPHDAEQGDAAVVAAVSAVSLVLEDSSLVPTQTEQSVKMQW